MHSLATDLFFVFFRRKKNKHNGTSYFVPFTKLKKWLHFRKEDVAAFFCQIINLIKLNSLMTDENQVFLRKKHKIRFFYKKMPINK